MSVPPHGQFPPGPPGQPGQPGQGYPPGNPNPWAPQPPPVQPSAPRGFGAPQSPAGPSGPHPANGQWGQFPGNAPGYPPPGGGPGKPKRIPLAVLIGGPVALVILLIIGLTVVALNSTSSPLAGDVGSGSPTDPSRFGSYWQAQPVRQFPTEVAGLTPGKDIADSALNSVDPRQFYWSILKRQSMQSITSDVHDSYITQKDFKDQFPGGSARRVAIDYKTRKFTEESDELEPDGNSSPAHSMPERCVGGKTMSYSTYGHNWSASRNGGEDRCAERMQPGKRTANSYTSDGIAAGGLSSADADKFISYLDDITGLFTVDKPQKVTGTDGKTYLRLDVTIKPVDPKYPGNTSALGVGFLDAAFAQTGKNPYDYPYSIEYGPMYGRQTRYYIDPANMLPAFSVTRTTPPIHIDGSPNDAKSFKADFALTTYEYPDHLDPMAEQPVPNPKMSVRAWPFAPREVTAWQNDRPTATGQPAAPGAPVPCDPDARAARWCFPADVTGQKILDAIKATQHWPCYHRGDRDSTGSAVGDDGYCNSGKGSISYDTENQKPDGALETVRFSASGPAAQDAMTTSTSVFAALAGAVWPDNPAIRTEAINGYQQLLAQCASSSGVLQQATLPSGYQIGCIPPGGVSVGSTTTYTMTGTIDVPIGGPQHK